MSIELLKCQNLNTALNMIYMSHSTRKVEPVEPINYDAPNNPYEIPDETCKCGRPAKGGICRECLKEKKEDADCYKFGFIN